MSGKHFEVHTAQVKNGLNVIRGGNSYALSWVFLLEILTLEAALEPLLVLWQPHEALQVERGRAMLKQK